jgi:methionine-rich copper-binding protein CopC
MFRLGALVGTIGILAGTAYHAAFKSAIPAPNATVVSPVKISITFTEAVMAPPISTFSLLNADSTEAMKLTVAATPRDQATIEATLAKALAPGKYIVRWKNGAADDGHPTKGAFAFTVAAPK